MGFSATFLAMARFILKKQCSGDFDSGQVFFSKKCPQCTARHSSLEASSSDLTHIILSFERIRKEQ
ncbi:MAG: hypothetical protein D6814_12720 [Calditrichaeota bacterium]|nr:MAG: hypothetical protein D6814_12720 [Calditrichota bacterium]